MPGKEKSSTFEVELDRLNQVVEKLESGNIPLDEMLDLYEEGMKLSRRLGKLLAEAELRVQKLQNVHEEQNVTPESPNGELELLNDDLLA